MMVGMAQRSWVPSGAPRWGQWRRGGRWLRCIVVKAAEVLQGRAVAQLVLVLPGQGSGQRRQRWRIPRHTAKGTHTAASGSRT